MRIFFVIILSTLFSLSVIAQSPQKMSYQAVIRNNSGVLITNQPVGIKISILDSSNVAVFVESHSTTTNVNGLVSLIIGGGAPVTGTISTINWDDGPYFIKTETDPTGGVNYTISGTSELLSVPYALYSTYNNSPTYTIGLHPELGGYVFYITTDGKHGLVSETQDQSAGVNWYLSQDIISNSSNHSPNGLKFTDWRLPTKYELGLMYNNRIAIGGFSSANYWSSTVADFTIAWNLNFSDGSQTTKAKSFNYIVRSIRTF